MDDLFDAAGSLREAYRSVDWAATSLGPPSGWSPALRNSLDIALHTRAPVTLFWGPDYLLLYNEAYVTMIGDKHPAALGSPTSSVFPEIYDTIGPMLDAVHAGGGATWVEDLRLLMNRHGFLEETYFTFSYSAIRGSGGGIEGVIDIAAETTAQVLGQRRLELLSRLNDTLVDLDDVPLLLAHALPVLRSLPEDLPDVDVVPPGTPELPAGLGGDLVVTEAGGEHHAWFRLGGEAVLRTRLSAYLSPDPGYLGFLRLVGRTLVQGLDRARALRAERRAASAQRDLAEALQRSLLVPPAQPEHLEVAVRYHPAAEGARIGGDWYDSFVLPDGRLNLVVGDVTGHDRFAAAAMSQVRNLLRGIAYALVRPPAQVLAALDEAIANFAVDLFATVVLAQVEHARGGRRLLRWSNAGHPPPVLLLPDGTARLLQTPGEPLLGTRFDPVRSDHTVELDPGAAVIFYTDGLIERRGLSLDDGFRELVGRLGGHGQLDAEALCDHLLEHFLGATEDDVVLTVLRVRPDGTAAA